MYDIVVIGAGPTGCIAAKLLVEYGYKVLLLEKGELPRYKSCSGILIKKSLDLVQKYVGCAVPDSVTCKPEENWGMVFTDNSGKEYKFEQPGLNVWRSLFDYWLAEKAVERGVEIREHTPVTKCEDFGDMVRVILTGENPRYVDARYAVVCEGGIGVIKKQVLRKSTQLITTYQTFNEGTIDLDPHYFYAYLQPQFSEYDAWFNVKDNLLVFGVAVKDTGKIHDFYNAFIKYMADKHKLHVDKQTKEERWIMPQIAPGCNIDYGKGRVFFAGECAGFLNPMGEGISAGMESAHYLADAIHKAFSNPELVLQNYRSNAEVTRSYMERQWNLVADLSQTFSEMRR